MSECLTCDGIGVVGRAPDGYFPCPECSYEPVDLDDVRDDRIHPNGEPL
jgi:hypothetical protein